MSPERFRLGLVVGKFAPLHRGHLWLIEQAAARCERVLVLSYSQPEPPGFEAAARRRWLEASCAAHDVVVVDPAWLEAACAARGLAPHALPLDSADDETQQHFLAWLLRDVLQRHPDALFASERYLEPCAAVLTRALGHAVTPVMGQECGVGASSRKGVARARRSGVARAEASSLTERAPERLEAAENGDSRGRCLASVGCAEAPPGAPLALDGTFHPGIFPSEFSYIREHEPLGGTFRPPALAPVRGPE